MANSAKKFFSGIIKKRMMRSVGARELCRKHQSLSLAHSISLAPKRIHGLFERSASRRGRAESHLSETGNRDSQRTLFERLPNRWKKSRSESRISNLSLSVFFFRAFRKDSSWGPPRDVSSPTFSKDPLSSLPFSRKEVKWRFFPNSPVTLQHNTLDDRLNPYD